ncbi:MAG: hypothetical protein KBD63_01935 [Bacteriovoracaceae bacterium]|nr:hypothetical protein [Bacteriovoracaceae bacterium]
MSYANFGQCFNFQFQNLQQDQHYQSLEEKVSVVLLDSTKNSEEKKKLLLKNFLLELSRMAILPAVKASWFAKFIERKIKVIDPHFSYETYSLDDGSILFMAPGIYRVYFEYSGSIFYRGTSGCFQITHLPSPFPCPSLILF